MMVIMMRAVRHGGSPPYCDAVLLLYRAGIYTQEDIGLFTKMLSVYLYNFSSLQIGTFNSVVGGPFGVGNCNLNKRLIKLGK